MTNPQEPLQDLFSNSKLLILNFQDIPNGISKDENIKLYFDECLDNGIDPKKPENRQKFNDNLLTKANVRYLVSRYGEDRSSMIDGSSIASDGRVLHLGVDVFSENKESVYSPYNGQIVRIGNEPDDHSFGYYLIIKPEDKYLPYIFFGHLGPKIHKLGEVKTGEIIARLGDFKYHENGGWSRHLHIQMLKELPPDGQAPIGYSSYSDQSKNVKLYPDPKLYFPDWKIFQSSDS